MWCDGLLHWPLLSYKLQRYITLLTKFHIVKAIDFPVDMYGWESWTIKKAERQRIDAFELWHWRRLLRVPWTARRSNKSILKEINPEYSLVGLMMKVKFQYLTTWFKEPTHQKRPWCWKRLKIGGEGDDRGWDSWMAWLTQWTWVPASSRRWWRTVHGVGYNWMTEQQQDYLTSVITHLLGKPFLLGLQREPYLRVVYREKNEARNYVLSFLWSLVSIGQGSTSGELIFMKF